VKEDRIIAATITNYKSPLKRGYVGSLAVPSMGFRWNHDLRTTVAPVQIASCIGTILKRELFMKIGGYDDGIILYGGAEQEFSVRAWLSGAEIVSVRYNSSSSADCPSWPVNPPPWIMAVSITGIPGCRKSLG
jgi:GT2 family glycosyltransferase